MMKTINNKAETIAKDIATTKESLKSVALDPFTILAIIGIIISLIQLYLTYCKKTTQEAASSMRNPNLVEKWQLRRLIRKHIDDCDVRKLLGEPLLTSLLKIGATITDEEVAKMYTEV
jgi:beta-lactamase regulating signal transducer with metallopeptidase domain